MNFIEQIIEVIELESGKSGRINVDAEIISEFNLLKNPADVTNNRPPQNRPVAAAKVADVAFERMEKAFAPPPEISGLAECNDKIRSCRLCVLSEFRQKTVHGAGKVPARMMMIAEAPSASDDDCGMIFSGEVGELLDNMLTAMHLSRAEIYLTSLVKCRPPGNRKLEALEVEQCVNYLKAEIAEVKPEVIVCFGAGFSQHVLRKNETISKLRGIFDAYDGIPVMPTFSPAYLLRKTSAKREVWSDLQQVMKLLKIKKAD